MARTSELKNWQKTKLTKLVRGLLHKYGTQPNLYRALLKAGYDSPGQQALSNISTNPDGRHNGGHQIAQNLSNFLGKTWSEYFETEDIPVIHGDLPGWEEALRETELPPELPPVALYLATMLPVSNPNLKPTPDRILKIARELYQKYPIEGRARAETELALDEKMQRDSRGSRSRQKIK